jgi:hypothetical protein
MTIEIPDQDALMRLPHDVYYRTTLREHANHCMWLLLRVHHALEHGERVDQMARSYDHSKHCLTMLLYLAKTGPHDLEQAPSYGNIGFGDC